MAKLKDVEIFELTLEINSEFDNILAQVKKTEKDHARAAEIFFDRRELREKYERLQVLERHLDRINIAEFIFDSSPRLYEEILNKGKDCFKKGLERDKEWEKILQERGEVGTFDLSEDLRWVDSEFEQGKELISDRIRNVARNYYELYPPLVKNTVSIPKRLKEIYAESRWCYVLQNYRASTALCRVIIELSIKQQTKKDMGASIGSTKQYLDSAFRMKIIPTDAHRIGHEVRELANKVLHAGKKMQKKNALKAVEKTKDFLEEVFKESKEQQNNRVTQIVIQIIPRNAVLSPMPPDFETGHWIENDRCVKIQPK